MQPNLDVLGNWNEYVILPQIIGLFDFIDNFEYEFNFKIYNNLLYISIVTIL